MRLGRLAAFLLRAHLARAHYVTVVLCSARNYSNLWKNPHIRFMKLKLLLTFTLLAIAAMVWNYELNDRDLAGSPQNEVPVDMQTSVAEEQPKFTRLPQLVPPIDYPSDDPELQLANYLEPAPLQVRETENATFQFASYAPTEGEPANLLIQAADNLADSSPIRCRSRMKINMFDQQVIAQGRYFNAGQGSGQTRLDLKIELNDDMALEVNQICDGKFFYRIEQLGEVRKIEFLDLSEFNLENSDELPDNPTQWLSHSGTISLLRNLGTAFDFAAPASQTMSGLNVLHLHGQWKPAAIENILNKRKHIDPETGAVNWRQLPEQVPHGVDVFLGNDDFQPLFPYRIVFFQFDPETDLKRPIVTMELFEVEKVAALSPDLFHVSGANSRQVDLSDAYQKRIQKMVNAASVRAGKLKTR